MDVLQEFRSQFPILSAFRTPPLISQNPSLGPLHFDPVPDSIKPILSSPTLIIPQSFPPQLSLPRFIETTAAVPRSAAKSISSLFGPQMDGVASTAFSHNRLQLLRCPSTGLVAALFPTGENSDQLGFVTLDKEFQVQVSEDGNIFKSSKRFSQSIVQILVNPIGDENLPPDMDAIIGYVMACTTYSAHWFAVKSIFETWKLKLVYLSSKVFGSSAIAGACWCSQLPELSAVLLEDGSLFQFDLEPRLCMDWDKEMLDHPKIGVCRLKVCWNDLCDKSTTKFLGCEFSWHPNILIVSHSHAVYSVDFRSDPCNVSCVAKVGTSDAYATDKKDHFVAMSTGPDSFHFVLASKKLLILCDLRKPLKPVLQWVHSIDEPCYINVFKLSQLRSTSQDDAYRWASESGFGILLGSFWNCDFSLFCFGPHPPSMNGGCVSKLSEQCRSFCAWELPSELLLASWKCHSGSGLLKDELSKDNIPKWIDWQKKKDIVLGFSILSGSLPPVLDQFGGFTVIRLMSCGKLEAQRYRASWEPVRNVEEVEGTSTQIPKNELSKFSFEEGYKFAKRFNYVKLDYLKAFLKGNLSSLLHLDLKNSTHSPLEKELYNPEHHAILCKMLERCDSTQSSSSSKFDMVLNDVSLPTTIREIELRRIWMKLPIRLLQLAFSSYSEFLEVQHGIIDFYHDFPVVSESKQLPPFLLRKPSHRSNKWSKQVQRGDTDIVGPIVPLPVLSSFHMLHGGLECETDDDGFHMQCDEVMKVIVECSRPESSPDIPEDHVVSLMDDRDEKWIESQYPKKQFLLHELGAFKPHHDRLVSKVSAHDHVQEGSQGSSGLEMFDDLCPIMLRFRDTSPTEFTLQKSLAYKVLKNQFVKRQETVIHQQRDNF
ncbi:hypothetical protein SAY86_030171 [Trapa natans]|uniref:Uncharacterized protein n=1 Tax=Trapa natans TaxID=22666 RepID=A0AAN7MKL9_TRANT|nr:hypothetical protein SAY86_030171 [Trapa natans]